MPDISHFCLLSVPWVDTSTLDLRDNRSSGVCDLEKGCFGPATPSPADNFVVMANGSKLGVTRRPDIAGEIRVRPNPLPQSDIGQGSVVVSLGRAPKQHLPS
jgi:hypothetical protein